MHFLNNMMAFIFVFAQSKRLYMLDPMQLAFLHFALIISTWRLLQVKDLEEPHLTEAVSVGFPTIVKTMMACGTNDAHTMVYILALFETPLFFSFFLINCVLGKA